MIEIGTVILRLEQKCSHGVSVIITLFCIYSKLSSFKEVVSLKPPEKEQCAMRKLKTLR
jgi:hypothetical protein